MMFRVALKDAHMYKVPRLHSTFCPSVSVHHALVFPTYYLFFICSVSASCLLYLTTYLILP